MNITLIGMPYSGKTTIGKELSKKLEYNFIDTDVLIETQIQTNISNIVTKYGEKFFLTYQDKTILSLNNNIDKTIISTGGSVIYSEKAITHLKSISNLIYLCVPYQTIENRFLKTRKIIGINNKTVNELYDERIKLYEKYSDLKLENNSIDKIIEDIISYINFKTKK